MYKHVSLRSRTVNGRPTWRLLGPDGQPIAAFDAFAHALRKRAKNTLDSYCRHLAEFLNYLIEFSTLFAQGRQLTKLELSEAIEAYGEFLQLGVDSGNEIARAVAAQLFPSSNSKASLAPKKAAVRRFLKLSEEIRKELIEMAQIDGRANAQVDPEPLLPELSIRRDLQPYEMSAMQSNSVIASVITGGPKLINSIVMAGEIGETPYDERRAFPYDKAMELIDTMPTYRDKTQYALLAACGCRTHEALQILTEDVDVAEGTVQLVNPYDRLDHPSYRNLIAEERVALAWKGRTTKLTLLIEPFASTFFESLHRYLEREYIAHGRNDFLLQYISGPQRGAPYFLSKATTRLEAFSKACKHIGVTLPPGTGPHSLRHMYGTYLLNYFPRANGEYGLPVPLVQQLMGHANLKSTLKYARYDKDLLKLEIQNANQVIFGNGTPKSLLELKLEALESQVAKIRTQIEQEAIAHG